MEKPNNADNTKIINFDSLRQKEKIIIPNIGIFGFLFSFILIIFIYASTIIETENFYIRGFISQLALILLPSILFIVFTKPDIKKFLRLNKLSFSNAVIVFFASLILIPASSLLNGIYLYLIRIVFGKIILPDIPTAQNSQELILSIFLIGLTAAVCEETLYRGIILRGLEPYGKAFSIVFTAFLFAVMHLSFQRFFGTFILGLSITYIVYRTNSLYSGILAHFVNNSFAVIMSFIASKSSAYLENSTSTKFDTSNIDDPFSSILSLSESQQFAMLILILIIFFVFALIYSLLMFLLIQNTRHINRITAVNAADAPENINCSDICNKNNVNQKVDNKVENNKFSRPKTIYNFFWFVPGFIFAGLVYYMEGLKLLGTTNENLILLLRAIRIIK